MDVFFASVEVTPLPECQMPGKGGFVYCFAPAIHAAQAEKRIRATLAEEHYSIRNWEYLKLYDFQQDWGSPELTGQYDEHAKEALRLDDVVFSKFYTYENDDE